MSRYTNPIPQYSRGGKPLSGLELNFYDVDTGQRKDTFSDKDETERLKNTNPVTCDADGRVPNIFYSGLARVIANIGKEQIFDRDNVGSTDALPPFDIYFSGEEYSIHVFTTTQDGRTWQSLGDQNIGNDPTTDDGTNWKQVGFNDFYTKTVTYSKLNKAISNIDKLTYISVVDLNLDNEPSVDSGANWELDEPVLDWVTGRAYKIGVKSRSKVDSRIYKSVILQSGNEPSADVGTNWLPLDGVVAKPVNTLPLDLAVKVSRTPTLSTNSFAVNGSSANQVWARFLLSTDGFSTIAYDTDITRSDLTSHVVKDKLEPATTYSFKVEKQGVRTDISEFSDVTTFTTTIDLTEVFDNVLFTGTGAVLSVVTTVDLNSNSGTIWINNTDATSPMRIVDTSGGVGNAILANTVSFGVASEPQGVTAFNINGFDVGTDAAYNGNTDNILSLTFKRQTGKYDEVTYTGNSTNRTIAHSLNDDVCFQLCVQLTGSSPGGSPFHFCRFKDQAATSRFSFADGGSQTTDASAWNSTAPTSSVFSLGTSLTVNGSGRTYKMYLWAHNPLGGTFCGTYVGTGVAGNKLVTGFSVVNFISKAHTVDWVMMDKTLGTSEYIILDSTAESAIGGPDSFDVDGITLGTIANDLGVTYYYIAQADPDLF